MTAARSSFRPGGYVARRPSLSPQRLRVQWACAVDLASGLSRVPADGAPAHPGDFARLIVALRELRHDNFPVESWSARQMAAAFLTLAGSFVRQEMGPEARTACAPFLAAGAACLDGLLNEARAEAARATWRGQTGERDDD